MWRLGGRNVGSSSSGAASDRSGLGERLPGMGGETLRFRYREEVGCDGGGGWRMERLEEGGREVDAMDCNEGGGCLLLGEELM